MYYTQQRLLKSHFKLLPELDAKHLFWRKQVNIYAQTPHLTLTGHKGTCGSVKQVKQLARLI